MLESFAQQETGRSFVYKRIEKYMLANSMQNILSRDKILRFYSQDSVQVPFGKLILSRGSSKYRQLPVANPELHYRGQYKCSSNECPSMFCDIGMRSKDGWS
jgi:hypothetical protein